MAEKRERFNISIDRKVKFPASYSGYFVKSSNLCKLFSDVFRKVYSDWEGCRFEFAGSIPTISAFFNQRMENIDGMVAATSIYQSKQTSGNNVVNRRRFMDESQTYGDRFFLTDEGKEGLEKYVVGSKISRRTGQVDWKNIVFPSSPPNQIQGSQMTMFNRVQYTQVAWLDPTKILKEIYGAFDEDGRPLDYVITSVKNNSSYPQGFMPPNLVGYLLRIDQIDSKEMEETGRQELGYTVTDDLGIVR